MDGYANGAFHKVLGCWPTQFFPLVAQTLPDAMTSLTHPALVKRVAFISFISRVTLLGIVGAVGMLWQVNSQVIHRRGRRSLALN